MKSIIKSILFIILTINSSLSFATHKQARVIIIGAGVAGLAAAQTLTQRHIPVLVLEARDRIGGRIQTVAPWGPGLDLGAAWIHGIYHNPIKRMTNRLRIRTIPTIYDDNALQEKFKSFVLYKEGAKLVSSSQLRNAMLLAKQFDAYLIEHKNSLAHTSTEEALTAFIHAYKIEDDIANLLRYVVTNSFLYEFAADLTDLSALANAPYEQSLVSGPNEIFPGGYGQVLASLSAHLPIKLNQAVIKIKYDMNGVDVYTKNQHYHAEYVLITVPLGVLKSGSMVFSPELPEAKQVAIKKLAMSTYEKTYLFFDYTFWDVKSEWIGYLPTSSNMNKSPDIMNMYPFTQSPILLLFTAGSFGKVVNTWDDKKRIAYLMTILKKIYGKNIPQPSSYVITHWSSDKYSLGSYSYLPVGVDKNYFSLLAQPVMNRLFFAGEATSNTDPGTVHGAYSTGIRAANEIIHLH